jgi:polar amino acid transport system permease protein
MEPVPFSTVVVALLKASWVTVSYAAAIITMGTTLGIILALIYSRGFKPIRLLISVFIFLVRGVPMLVHLFISFYVLPLFGLRLPAVFIALAGLSIANSAYICEIIRGAIESIPRGQTDAYKGIGMTYWMGMRKVILPQAVRHAMPPLISWWVIMVKVTSLISVLSIRELTLTGRELATFTLEPFTVFGMVALIYFAINFPLARFGEYLGRKYTYKH